MKKLLFRTLSALLLVFSLNGCLAGKYMSNVALLPSEHGVEDIPRTRAKADSLAPGSTRWYDSLRTEGVLKDAWITNAKGRKLHAVYAPAACPESANGTAVVVHGYTDNHYVFIYLLRMYRDEFNYNILAPDLSYFGESEGDHAQMGWHDRLDLAEWVKYAHGLFKDDFLLCHGVSMGGATVMMMSGDPLPPYVKCLVEDCGYSSVWDQFAHNLKDNYHLPAFPVLNSASIVSGRRYGWNFREASAVEQLKKSTVPMLFIHGDADTFVPLSHLHKNYAAKTKGYKQMYVCPGAVHANSFAKDPATYKAKVLNFLKTVRNMIAVGNYPDGAPCAYQAR